MLEETLRVCFYESHFIRCNGWLRDDLTLLFFIFVIDERRGIIVLVIDIQDFDLVLAIISLILN